jgi:FkbM family methyltransferase
VIADGTAATMGLQRTLQLLVNHPLNRGRAGAALSRFVRWQIGSRVLGHPVLLPMGGGGALLTRRGDTGATGNFYCGLHEFPDMLFVVHALRAGELFLDVGANVGSYSVLAAKAVGARVVACEPVAWAHQRAACNVGVNQIAPLVDLRRVAVGDKPGEVVMTSSLDTVNHVMAAGEGVEGEIAPVVTLDSLAEPGVARLLKIDVEGFELRVIEGGARVLSEPTLLGVIVELNGSGQRYGIDDEQIDRALRGFGLEPCGYDPFSRKLTRGVPPNASGNTLYVRFGAELQDRLRTAPPVDVFGRKV